jgi:hypothetical protein
VPRSALPLVLTLSLLLGCAPRLGSAGDQVIRIHPLQEPIDRQATAVVEVLSAVWGDGVDVRTITREAVEGALHGAQLFARIAAPDDASRYLVRVEMLQRPPVGRSPGETDGAVSVFDRQRNVVTATFRIRQVGASDDPRRAAQALGRTVAEVLREPVVRD